jgi:hypothetical protein
MSEVKVSLNAKDEIALLDRYGRRCSRETLVKRAIAEVLKQQAENIPIFVGKEEHEARVKAAEAQRLAEEAARALPAEVVDILYRFSVGEKFVDEDGREVTALEANPDADDREQLPLLIQVGGDNSEWFPIPLSDLKPAPVAPAFDSSIHTVPESEAAQVPEGTKTVSSKDFNG